jgi:ketosteroid isomerase-like protein
MARSTREIVETYFNSINTRDWDTWLALFTDDVVVDEALSGHTEGIEAMRQSAAGIQQGFKQFENRLDEIVVEADQAMVVCTITATTVMDTSLVSTGANFYRMRDGKIAYMSSYHDREPFLKAFGAA